MNTYVRVPITVVVVDSGPLISLAACGRLDLLGSFSRPIRIADVARAESVRDLGKIGAPRLADWFSGLDPSEYTIVETPLLRLWEEAVASEEAGDTTHPSKGIGDAAAAWVLSRMAWVPHTNEVSLILIEDANLGDVVVRQQFPEVYALSTRAFLQTLQNFGKISSAADVIAEIARAGRVLARYMADRPGVVDRNTKSTWTDTLGIGVPPLHPK
jgi:hypothetical protein